MNNKNHVRVGVTGKFVKLDPANQEVQSVSTELTGIEYGYISEDGVRVTPEKSTENRKAWQNGDVVRVLVEDASVTFSFTLIQNTKEVRDLYYAGTEDENGHRVWKPSQSANGRFAIYIADPNGNGDATQATLYVFDGVVSAVEEITYANTELVGYGVTLQALGDVDVWNTVDTEPVGPEGTESNGDGT